MSISAKIKQCAFTVLIVTTMVFALYAIPSFFKAMANPADTQTLCTNLDEKPTVNNVFYQTGRMAESGLSDEEMGEAVLGVRTVCPEHWQLILDAMAEAQKPTVAPVSVGIGGALY